MFGGNASSQQFFPNQIEEKPYQFDSTGPLQLQLFGTENPIFDMDTSNYLGINLPNPSISVQNTNSLFGIPPNPNLNCGLNLGIQNSSPNLNCGLYLGIQNPNPNLNCGLNLGVQNPNPNLNCGLNLGIQNTEYIRVSTGLKLSNDEPEYNSYVSSCTAGASRELLNIFEDLRPEFAKHDREVDRMIRIQEREFYRGYLEAKQHYTSALVTSLSRKFEQEVRKKNQELETITAKNRDLAEKLQQAATEAQQWQLQAWQSQSTVNSLNEQLRQAAEYFNQFQPVEEYAENEVEASSAAVGEAGQADRVLKCRKCGGNEAVMILIPCRHLALCQWCERNEAQCPVCLNAVSHSVQVNFN
ncbi:hypothetical protein LUZ60_013390 [Juncus effusus]|nr:hypothetical protein LUZ60_013390 [Juncus effusus]